MLYEVITLELPSPRCTSDPRFECALTYTGRMLSPKLAELVATQERTSRMIWFSMCMAIFVYAAVVVVTAQDTSQSGEPGDISLMLPILAGVSVVTAIMARMS